MKKLFLGMDIGGTRIKGAVLNEDGNVVKELLHPTEAHLGKDKVLDNILRLAREACNNYLIVAIGLAVASPLEPNTGVLYYPPNLPFEVFNLKAFMEGNVKLPVFVENDANAYVLGEWWKGAGQGAKVLLGITLGTGIGGGLVVEGKVWHGAHGFGGEFGHTTIQIDGPLCNCGNRGCFEAMASSRFLVETYQRLSMKQEMITPPEIYEKAVNGDKHAFEAFRIFGRNVAIGLASLCNALNPDVVVIGGGLANAGNAIICTQLNNTLSPSFCPV